MSDVLDALLLFLPAGIANATPVVVSRLYVLRGWNKPIDLGHSYKGKRILGNNKTWRGLGFGVLMAGITGALVATLINRVEPSVAWFFLGCVMGFGALYGDAVESFIKRQLGIKSGQSWFPFDQIDYILGGLLATAPLGLFDWTDTVAILVVYFILHLAIAYTAYILKFKDRPI